MIHSFYPSAPKRALPEGSPERALAAEVILRAWRDVFFPPKGNHIQKYWKRDCELARKDAVDWFLNPSSTLEFWCIRAGLTVDQVRKIFLKYWTTGKTPPRIHKSWVTLMGGNGNGN